MKRFSYFLCLQFLSVFASYAVNDTLVVKYGQDLDSIVSYNKQGEVVSKYYYSFDSDHLSSATIEADNGIYVYQYTYAPDSYIEDVIFSEKAPSSGDLVYQTRKTIERNADENTEYNYVWQNNSWQKLNGSIAVYTNNMLSQLEDVEGLGDNWIVTKQINYLYYNSSESIPFAGKLKEIHSFSDGVNESAKIEYRYLLINNDICLQSETVYSVDNAGNFQKCMSTEYSYPSNDQENVISTISYFEPETQELIGKEIHTLSRQTDLLNSYQFQAFDASNKMVESRNNSYSYLNNKQTVEETNSITDLTNSSTQVQQTRFSTNLLDGNKPESVVQEILSGNNWVKEEELLTSYNDKGDPIRKDLKRYTGLTQTPVLVYRTEWNYKPGAGVDTYTTYSYDEATSQTVKSWSFAVFYPGDGSIDPPDALKKVEKSSRLSIYPNPASENIFVAVEGQEFNPPVQYSIYSLTGKLQQKGVIYTLQDGISVTMLASGNYVLRLTKDGTHSSCVFVKQ
ncbi:MAG: T9SS type A sorting domain-containing protein [Candidatus Azobacteroides sp.]|nr:T9SS type A sorting domain-containing protein [Candidatus Azobacteroides sp.]